MIKNKMLAAALAAITFAGTAFAPIPAMADSVTEVVALGADLTSTQKATVLGFLDVKESDLTDANTVTVTNADEHTYLDGKIAASYIGTRALSSCKVTEASDGHGIKVTTHNINYVTADMYENALATAGMKNADVIVAAPSSISGTAALVGAMKAYEKMSGDVIQPEAIDTATDELVTTSQIAENTGDADKTSQLVAGIKQAVAADGTTDDSKISKTIDDIASQLGITLSDTDKQALIALAKKLASMDLDPDTLAQQAKGVYEAATKNGLDLSKYGISTEDTENFFAKLPQVFRALIDWLKGLFS